MKRLRMVLLVIAASLLVSVNAEVIFDAQVLGDDLLTTEESTDDEAIEIKSLAAEGNDIAITNWEESEAFYPYFDDNIDRISNHIEANSDTLHISSNGEWQYQISSDNPHNCFLTAYLGKEVDIMIPLDIDNLFVIDIPKPAYFFYEGLNANSVIMPRDHDYWYNGMNNVSETKTTADGIWYYSIIVSTWPMRQVNDGYNVYQPYVLILAYNSSEDEINIPERLHNYPVYVLGPHSISFSNAMHITFPKSLIGIGSETFYKCPNLEIIIPDNLVELGGNFAIGCHRVVMSCKYGTDYDLSEVDTLDILHKEEDDPEKIASCTKTGLTKGSHCSICGKVLVPQVSIPAKEHTPVADPAIPATYTSTGLTEGSLARFAEQFLWSGRSFQN